MASRTYTTGTPRPQDGATTATGDAASTRRLALGGALAGAIGLVAAIGDQVAAGSTDVSKDVWGYPWSSGAFVATTLVFILAHVLLFGMLIGLRRSGLTGPTRGVGVAMIGTAIVFAAETASLPAADVDVESTYAVAVLIPLFGLGGLLAAIGLIVAGRATLQAGRWKGGGRFTPLGLGVAALLPTLLGPTEVFGYGFMVYAVALMALGAALAARVGSRPLQP